ncbi:glycoside hydrolase superfamily [Dactylonectria macrodidyma]|uniref:beta-glucosidase n=1 Tax=Dactylonectria macrodidyma TaxID=307937 RepID=A0A9P9ESE8_9HYPO|nr:glycoside hydrolase superfamily [Dactylonectria macrodidyma]
MESATLPNQTHRTHLVDYGRQAFTFERAVSGIKAGQDLSTVANRLLTELSLPERLHLLDGDEPFYKGLRGILCDRYNRVPFVHGAIHRLGIPGIKFTDGPRGVVMGSSTAFPVSMARGATWDTELERRVGDAIGLEAKAQGANYFAGVCVNLPRHPAWGRIQETYGEDPVLLGEFGAALTQGVQNHVMACVKHFALNSMENARFRVDVDVEEDVLHEVYLPHFRQIVDSGVASVMSAYNSVNGQWAGQNKDLLTTILRDEWEFTGFVLSDFIFGLRDAALSVKNGLDVEAPFAQQRGMHLKNALASGALSWSDVNRAAARILRTQLDFTARTRHETPDMSVVFCEEHRQLAREVAQRSIVMLKNDLVGHTSLLPLVTENLSTLAVIGHLANTPNTGDKGSSQVFSPSVVTPFQGLCAALPSSRVTLEDSDCVENAAKIAAEADVAICIVGYDASDEGEYVVPSLKHDPCLSDLFPPAKSAEEKDTLSIVQGASSNGKQASALEVGAGGDRKSLRLRARDVEIIQAVAAANPKTIVVIVCAGAVIMEEWNHDVPSILISWYSGSEGGHALADVLLGQADAGGRLPFSIPKDESHLPHFDIEASSIKYDRWYGQALLDRLGVRAAFPLGYGLSYTEFLFSDLRVHGGGNEGREHARLSVSVSNIGSRPGNHVAQVYGYPQMADFPSRVLLGFASVELRAGESKQITIKASLRPVHRWVNGKFEYLIDEMGIEVASYAGDTQAISTTYRLRR